ncbi:MAG: hypothetical protein Q6370_001895 [Candidatus Sigynarchaeota archaeon]
MNVVHGLKSPEARGGIQLLLVTCAGAMATDAVLGAIGSVNQVGIEDVGWIGTIIAAMVAGLVAGHVLRGRRFLVELVSAPVAFACLGFYIMIKMLATTAESKFAVAAALTGLFAASLSLLDAFPAGRYAENRRGGLVDDGAIFAIVVVAGTFASLTFVSSPLVEKAWIVPAAIIGGTGVAGLLVAVLSRREVESRAIAPLQHPLLGILRGHMLGLAIVVFMLASFELDWINHELFGRRLDYILVPDVLINAYSMLAGLGGCITGGMSAKACLLAARRPARVVGAALLVFVPLLVSGILLYWSIVLDWILPGSPAFVFVAGHVAGLILQFTDSGYKGIQSTATEAITREPGAR